MGGLPPTANEQNIATFFSNALAAVGGTTAGPGESVPTPESVVADRIELQASIRVRSVARWWLSCLPFWRMMCSVNGSLPPLLINVCAWCSFVM